MKRALVLLLLLQAGCAAVAKEAGRGAAEGAVGKLAAKVDNPQRIEELTEGIKRQVIGGTMDELSQPQRLGELRRIAGAVTAGAVGASAGQLATAAEQASASMARGAREELGGLFPACRGTDAASCLDQTVERVSRAGTAGIAAGVRESLGIWPLVLAFAGGALFALAAGWAIYVARRVGSAVRPAIPRSADPRRPSDTPPSPARTRARIRHTWSRPGTGHVRHRPGDTA